MIHPTLGVLTDEEAMYLRCQLPGARREPEATQERLKEVRAMLKRADMAKKSAVSRSSIAEDRP